MGRDSDMRAMVESVRVMDNSQAARSECAEVTVSTLSKAIVAALEDESRELRYHFSGWV